MFNKQEIKILAKEISDLYESSDISLTAAAIKILASRDYTNEQIKRICEEANVFQYLKEFEKADPPRKNIVFKKGPVDANTVLLELGINADVAPFEPESASKEAEAVCDIFPTTKMKVAQVPTRNVGSEYTDLMKQASILSDEMDSARRLYENAVDNLLGQTKFAASDNDLNVIWPAIEKVAQENWIANLAKHELEQQGYQLGKVKVAHNLRLNENHPLVDAIVKFGAAAHNYAVKETAFNNIKNELSNFNYSAGVSI